MTTATAEPLRGDNAEGGEPIEARESGPLTAEEHAQATAARPREATPQTLEENLHKLLMKGVMPDPTHRPSHPEPGTKVVSGVMVEGPYRVPLSLDPKNIEVIEGINDENIGYVRVAIEAFGEAQTALKRLSDARDQVRKDPSKTQANQILIIAAEAEKLQERMTRKMDLAVKTLSDGIAHIEKGLNETLTARADTTLSREVREYVAKLPVEKRHGFLDAALKNSDLPTLHAILGAQPFLSGITPETRAHFTRALREKTDPAVALRVKVMKRALELVAKQGPLVLTEVIRVQGADWQMVRKLRNAKNAADQALLLINNPVS